MTIDWTNAFSEAKPAFADAWTFRKPVKLGTLAELKGFLDLVHIKHCLLKPFCQQLDYPLVETRELLPSFECDLWEYRHLPGFSLVAFGRPINYFSELFQFDILHPVPDSLRPDIAQAVVLSNMNTLLTRLPRSLHDNVRAKLSKENLTDLNYYQYLMPYLTTMDRAQVIGTHGTAQGQQFYLAGVYASFPSDLDTEVKRYGLRIGKFTLDHPELYERNRNFVCQYLMELYGYPFSSERRTSAALFARKLHKIGERFLVRTVSQSDRTITTNWSDGGSAQYPNVEKLALVSVDADHELLPTLRDRGFLVNQDKRVVILRVCYHQHAFSADNVREERALSVFRQELVHPVTGEIFPEVSIIRDSTNMVLRLNDIVRGEHQGSIIYKRNEVVENTVTEDNRLKFLYAWFCKHQRRMIGYSDDFFAGISKVISTYLHQIDLDNSPDSIKDLYAEVNERYNYILQARTIRLLEDLAARKVRGEKISYAQMLAGMVELLHSLKFEIVSYFDSLVTTAIAIGETTLNNRYIVRNYVEKQEDELTQVGLEIKKNYGRLVTLIHELKSIRKTKQDKFRMYPSGM